MAEGFLRSLAGDRFEVASAGTQATRVHPLAIRAMADAGIDLSGYTSKVVDELVEQPWDHVITVCDAANEACPCSRGSPAGYTGASRIPHRPPGTTISGSRYSGESATRSSVV
jgi:protein-tyrosine-phosphatase